MKSCHILMPVVAVSLCLASPAVAVTFDWVTVGDPGNACDPHPSGGCLGAVNDVYRIARHEVTNAQYAEFLNAKAASDPLGLYNPEMGTWAILFGTPVARAIGWLKDRALLHTIAPHFTCAWAIHSAYLWVCHGRPISTSRRRISTASSTSNC